MDRLRENTRILKEGLDALGFDTGASTTPVVPLLLGDEWRAYRWAQKLLLEHGIFTSAVTFPAVSPGQARLRLCATASHRPEHYERLFEGLRACKAAEERGCQQLSVVSGQWSEIPRSRTGHWPLQFYASRHLRSDSIIVASP